MNTIIINGLELTTVQAWALAQLTKRIGWDEIRINAKDESEAHIMRDALNQLRTALAEYGYAPR